MPSRLCMPRHRRSTGFFINKWKGSPNAKTEVAEPLTRCREHVLARLEKAAHAMEQREKIACLWSGCSFVHTDAETLYVWRAEMLRIAEYFRPICAKTISAAKPRTTSAYAVLGKIVMFRAVSETILRAMSAFTFR